MSQLCNLIDGLNISSKQKNSTGMKRLNCGLKTIIDGLAFETNEEKLSDLEI